MQVLIFGMHRSGTSALTGLLEMMGLFVGDADDLMPPKSDNPKGFWERQEISDIHQDLLGELGMSWDAPLGLDLGDLSDTGRSSFVERLREQVVRLDREAPWAVKDPLLCLLFPIWRELLTDPVAIFIHRCPLQVAESLHTRNGLPMAVGIALWELYTSTALELTKDLPRILVRHEDLMTNPVSVVDTVHSFAERLGSSLQIPPRTSIESFIDPSLFHAKGKSGVLDSYLNSTRRRLLAYFEDATALERGRPCELSGDSRDILKMHFEAKVSSRQLEDRTRDRDRLFAEKGEELERIDSLAEELGSIGKERDALFDEKSRLLEQLEASAAEQSGLFESKNRFARERDELFEEKNALLVECGGLFEEKNALLVECGGLLEEKNSLSAERDALWRESVDLKDRLEDLENAQSDLREILSNRFVRLLFRILPRRWRPSLHEDPFRS